MIYIVRHGQTDWNLEGKLKTECENVVDFTDENERKLGIKQLLDFRGRITNFFDDLKEKYSDKNILVVTHAGVSIYARCYFEREPKDGKYNNYKKENKLRVLVKKVGEYLKVMKIDNTLEAKQKLVNGLIETIPHGDTLLICNEEGKYLN